jgi:hypothetical protein
MTIVTQWIFVAALDRNLHGEEILWVDYDTGIFLHQVHTTNLQEQRAQRLSSPTPLDNRISFGCINVPVQFYKTIVSPAFTGDKWHRLCVARNPFAT